ncbi:hypothetical protein IWW34DRAFT_857502 [Fusarium oxysporum f. sp. albedinis]|nr:hypothetical protein IWW34DRAFT_857502 [Fusarium oxysporum f. sp. albedinis]
MTFSLDEIVNTVVKHSLSNRRPRGEKKALAVAEKAPNDSTDSIILKHGKDVWSAYYAATHATHLQQGFGGKADLTSKLRFLEKQDVDTRETFANRLAQKMNEPDTNEPDTNEPDTNEPDTNEPTRSPAKRPRTTDHNITDSIQPRTTTNGTDTLSDIVRAYDPQQIPDHNLPIGDVYLGASLEEAKKLFNKDFWDTIKRVPSKENPHELTADVSIIFHQDFNLHMFGCQVEIGITNVMLSHTVLKLYDASIRCVGGFVSALLPGGCLIEPGDGGFTLRRCRRDLSVIFEGDLYQGVCSSPIYMKEGRQARDYTEAVSIRMQRREEHGATIIVHVAEFWATRMMQNLYKR